MYRVTVASFAFCLSFLPQMAAASCAFDDSPGWIRSAFCEHGDGGNGGNDNGSTGAASASNSDGGSTGGGSEGDGDGDGGGDGDSGGVGNAGGSGIGDSSHRIYNAAKDLLMGKQKDKH